MMGVWGSLPNVLIFGAFAGGALPQTQDFKARDACLT